jgi:hypothetical protein
MVEFNHSNKQPGLKMAYMNQTKKATIAQALALVVPKGWRYSLSVRNRMVIVMTIQSASADLIGEILNKREGFTDGNVSLNLYWLECAYQGELLETMEAIKGALNTDNHDNSDLQTDYFDVGHYVDLSIGKWDKPFVVK